MAGGAAAGGQETGQGGFVRSGSWEIWCDSAVVGEVEQRREEERMGSG